MKLSIISIIVLACSASGLANPAPSSSNTLEKLVAIKKEALNERAASEADLGWARDLEASEDGDARKRAAASVTGTVNTDGLKYRTCPKTSCTAVGQYSIGTRITIVCRTQSGTTVVGGWPWWDRLSNGYYVSDLYVDWTGGVPAVC